MAAVQYKCPNCNASMVFDPTAGAVKCEYCETTFQVDALTLDKVDQASGYAQKIEDEYMAGEKAENYWQQVHGSTAGYLCPSCGGTIVGTEVSASLFCPYCGNPSIIESSLEGKFRPDMIIPFCKTKDEAIKAYNDFCGDSFLLPDAFRMNHAVERVTGIYVPYHLLTCDAEGDSGLTGETRERWSDSEYDYERTNYYKFCRRGEMSFTYVPQDASSSIDDQYMQTIEPFDYKALTDFNVSYLSGFLADKYDETPEDCLERLDSRVKETLRLELEKTVSDKGYSSVATETMSHELKNVNFKYVLMPVWLLRTKYNNEFYYFAMNGQTGKCAGRMPIDRKKLTAASFGISMIGLVIGGILGYLFGDGIGMILGGTLCALIAGLVSRSALPAKLRNVAPKTTAYDYIHEALSLSQEEDTFVNSRVSKTRRSQPSKES